MNSKLIVSLSLILLGILTIIPSETNARDLRRRRRGDEVDSFSKSKFISWKDYKSLENAVKAEIQANNGDPSILTPEKLDQLVEEHNEELPWYRRLLNKFQEVLPRIIKAVARSVLDEVIVPTLRGQRDY